jgi:hypothetical protein
VTDADGVVGPGSGGGRWVVGIVLLLVVLAGNTVLSLLSNLDPATAAAPDPEVRLRTMAAMADTPWTTARLTSYVLPGVFRPVQPPTADGNPTSLAARALVAPFALPPVEYVGMLPLLLALMAFFTGPPGQPADMRRLRWAWRVLLVAMLFLLPGATPGALAVLACIGLVQLRTLAEDLTASMGVAVGALVLTTVLTVLALNAGSAPPGDALAFLLDRLEPAAREQAAGSAAWLAANAEHLGRVLDAAALSAFGSLVALLAFLKTRNALTTALLVLVTAADLGAHAVLWAA